MVFGIDQDKLELRRGHLQRIFKLVRVDLRDLAYAMIRKKRNTFQYRKLTEANTSKLL